MDQLPSAPSPPTAAPPPAAATPAAQPVVMPEPRRHWLLAPALWGLLAILALAVGGFIAYTNLARELTNTRAELAAARADVVAEAAQATRIAHEVEGRVDDLARELDQVKEQRAALDQLYLDLTRGRDEATLLDIERTITLAAQDLRFTGHVPGALSALQGADARLARLDRPQYLPLRRALARDIDRLRGVPVVDITGIALKLDQVATSIDALPMLSDAAAKPARVVPPPAPAVHTAPAKPESTWDRVRAWMGDEFGDLVRIREVDTPETLLLSNVQQQLVRDQFRLRLLDARQALLARNERIFRADLTEAQALLNRYFDAKSANGSAMLLQLRQLAQSTLSVEVPSLDESLAAVRATRPVPPPPAATR